AAVLALLLKTISSDLGLRDYGIRLCQTLLQVEQLKLVRRGLSVEKHKEFIISPCLRLLTEIVSFDDAKIASKLYARRDFTFDVQLLARNLASFRNNSDEQDRNKPSVRSNAVRYLLANLKYQGEGEKTDILKQRPAIRTLFAHLSVDPPGLAAEILNVLKDHVVADICAMLNSQEMDFRRMYGRSKIRLTTSCFLSARTPVPEFAILALASTLLTRSVPTKRINKTKRLMKLAFLVPLIATM
ncbi:hypothetical protein LTS18_012461, partial [Coniosporium uncinatum]